MKKNIFFLAILLITGGLIFTSCEKEDELSSNKEILSFIFGTTHNPNLNENVLGTISGTDVIAEVPFGTNTSDLVPSIEVSPGATISPAPEVETDFSNPVNYTVTAEDGSTKVFTVNVPVAPAPYIGSWETETSVNIESLGLSRVNLDVDESGNIQMELKSTLTGELFAHSIKGHFDPKSVCNTQICLEQTERWLDGHWTAEDTQRCIMYECYDGNMTFKYCKCYPMSQWWFTVHLVKSE